MFFFILIYFFPKEQKSVKVSVLLLGKKINATTLPMLIAEKNTIIKNLTEANNNCQHAAHHWRQLTSLNVHYFLKTLTCIIVPLTIANYYGFFERVLNLVQSHLMRRQTENFD